MKRMLIWLAGIAVAAVAVLGALWWYVAWNVEVPAYTVARSDAAFEVRDYPPLVLAEVTTTGDRMTAASRGFRPLAGYIFAKERTGDKIAMTAPVNQVPANAATADNDQTDRWTIQFVMPAKYDLETLPKPANAEIRLIKQPAQRRVAVRFSGVATDQSIAENAAKLRAWAERNGINLAGGITIAYYNDPWTPGFMRRNEVLIDVRS